MRPVEHETTSKPRAVPGSDPDEVLIFEPGYKTRRVTWKEFEGELTTREIVVAAGLNR